MIGFFRQNRIPLILATGLVLRCVAIQERGIWYDDAFSVLLSAQPFPSIISGTAADTMPPLYYFLLHIWMQFGQEIAYLRLLNVLLSTFSLYIFFLLVKELLNTRVAEMAAFLAAISPFQIYHAQEIRMYVILMLAQLGYAWAFVKIWRNVSLPENKTSRRLPWFMLVLCGSAAMYSHNLAVFTLAVPLLFLLFCKAWKLLQKMLAAQVVIAILFLPWLWLLPGQVDKIQQAFWTPRPGLVEIIQAMILFTASLPLPAIWQMLVMLLSFEILAFVFISTCKLLKNTDKTQKNAVFLLLAFALLPPLGLFICSYFMRPVFVARGFIFSSLAYLAIGAWVIQRQWSWQRFPAVLIGGSFILSAAISLPYQYTFNAFPRSPYRQVIQSLESAIRPGDLILHDNKLSFFPCKIHAAHLPQSFLPDAPGSHNDTLAPDSCKAMHIFPASDIESAVSGYQRIFFVVFSKAIQEYQDAGKPHHPSLDWLNQYFKLTQKTVFNDLEVYQFERRP